ncbi:MAG: translation initiation factor IF-2 [Chordicoccus sp.]
MTKIRVHELAAEIGKSNKDVINYLSNKGYDVKTAVSLVPENEIGNIKAAFGVAEKTPANAAGSPKEQTGQAEENAEKQPKKKSGIMRVFRSQNAKGQLQRRPKKAAETPKHESADHTANRKTEAGDGEFGSGASVRITPKEQPETRTVAEQKSAEHRAQEAVPAKAGAAEVAVNKGRAEAETSERSAKMPKQEEVRESVRTEMGKRTESMAASAESDRKHEEKTQETETNERRNAEPVSRNAGTQGSGQAEHGRGERNDRGNGARNGDRYGSRNGDRGARNEHGARNNDRGNGTRNGDRYGNRNNEHGTRSGDRYGNRNGSGQGGYQSRSGQGGYGSRNGNGQGGYGNRNSGGQGGYGNRSGQGSYGNRSGQGSYGNRSGQGSYGSRNGQGSYGNRNGQGGYGNRSGQGSYGNRNGQGGYGNRNGQGSSFGGGFGARRGASSRPSEGDGALAHKTSRDFRGNGKDRERTHEERREMGRHGDMGNRPNQQRRQFNRIPKALQKKQNQNSQPAKAEEKVTEIKIPEKITIRDLAEKMKVPASTLIKELFMKGEMVTVNHEIPFEKAEEIAMDHDILCEKEEKEDVIGNLLAEDKEDEKDMVPRPPVVCVMGHVDHGKTSLLDAIRHTHVTDKEAGGITQHIGAYMVSINGKKITFLDTPGHEAFTAMRMRGANSTDIAVLVVAADDGVMPQTVEAINHAKAANVEIIVAVNKIDKPGANIDRVKQELSEYGLVAEDWGGDTIFCPVSAKTHEGLDNLLEMIQLTAEMHELKANPNRLARGLVLEARLDKGRGPVASILVQKGTLHQGDFIACGAAHGKVRAMTDEKGKRLHKATPSMPCEIIGLSDVPEAGEVLMAFDTDKEAKEFASVFVTEGKKNLIEETKTQMSLEDLYKQIKEGGLKELPIVVKADVQGSVEAVSQSLQKLSNDEVVVKIIHGGVGAITESDVSLAAASNAIIIGFNVRPDASAKKMAEQQKVDIHLYNIIYEAIEDVERALKGMRAAVYEEKVQGHAEIRQMFKSSSAGNIAGAAVKDGIIQKTSKVRVFRGEEKIYEGDLASLKRFKDDVKEVREGFECGLVFKDWGDFEVGDTVEAYTMVEVERD